MPLWEQSLANLNALVKKNPETIDEKKMNVLISAMIELQQEYRASVIQCEKLKGRVADLTKEVEEKDKLLQERSLQVEAAHFRISGLTYLEDSEKFEEEKNADEDDEPGGGAGGLAENRSCREDNTKFGEVRHPRTVSATEGDGSDDVFEKLWRSDCADAQEKIDGIENEARNTSPTRRKVNVSQWKNPYAGCPVKSKIDSQFGSSDDRSLSPSSVQDISVGSEEPIMETLEI